MLFSRISGRNLPYPERSAHRSRNTEKRNIPAEKTFCVFPHDVRGKIRLGFLALWMAAFLPFPAKSAERKGSPAPERQLTPESIVRISRIEVDPARLPEYLALVAECGRASMAEEAGVRMMFSMQEKAHPERITILEIYADPEAYGHHIRSAHFRKYKERSLEMVRKLELLDQIPLVPEMKMK